MHAVRTGLLGLWVGLLGAIGCADHGDETKVLECSGECVCDPETATCSCLGGTDCVVEGGDDVNLVCEGNARCDLACGVGCHVECPGTSGCDVVMGDGSTGVCNGTGDCAFVCEGSCVIDCPGASRCTLDCPEGAACDITSCPMVTECGDGNLACRTACPEDSGN